MKSKLFLLTIIAVLAFGASRAAGTEPVPEPETGCINKKNDINGAVSSSEAKKPVKEVNVTAFLLSKKEKSVVTDENGNYAFDDLKPGTYKFVFEKIGFKKVVKDKVIIKTDEAFQMNIEMVESQDFELAPTPFHFSDF